MKQLKIVTAESPDELERNYPKAVAELNVALREKNQFVEVDGTPQVFYDPAAYDGRPQWAMAFFYITPYIPEG